MLRLSTLAALVVSLAAPATAIAAPSSRLVYARGHGAEACPDETALRRAVAARVGYDPFFPWAPLTVTVEITREGGHLRARVLVVDEAGIEKGTQALQSTGAGCDDLVESTALAVSIALDAPPKAPPPSEPSPEPAPAPEPAAAPPPPAAVPPVTLTSAATKDDAPRPPPPERSPNPLSLWAAAGARASGGSWSAASFGPALLVELRRGSLGLAAEGRYDVASFGLGPGAQASVQRATGSLLPCAHVAWFVGCGVASFGALWARGNVATPQTASEPYVALGGRVGADVALLPKLHLLATADVVGVATPAVVEVDGGRSSASSRPVEASGGLAVLLPIL